MWVGERESNRKREEQDVKLRNEETKQQGKTRDWYMRATAIPPVLVPPLTRARPVLPLQIWRLLKPSSATRFIHHRHSCRLPACLLPSLLFCPFRSARTPRVKVQRTNKTEKEQACFTPCHPASGEGGGRQQSCLLETIRRKVKREKNSHTTQIPARDSLLEQGRYPPHSRYYGSFRTCLHAHGPIREFVDRAHLSRADSVLRPR